MSMSIETMTQIQNEKAIEIGNSQQDELDAETSAVAETKRKTFDLPTNAVKVDPLR